MNKKVKALLLVLCALVFAAAGVFATLAYLNDTTKEVVNTVSVGDIQITMDEAEVSVDEYGEVSLTGDRTQENQYNLVPGMTYPKDPTIHVEGKSEPTYLFIHYRNDIADAEVKVDADASPEIGTIAEQMAANGWVLVQADADEDGVNDYTDLYVYNGNLCVDDKDYIVNNKNVASKENVLDVPIFAQFKVDPDLEQPDLGNYAGKTIQLKACAVQAYGLSMTEAAELADAELTLS